MTWPQISIASAHISILPCRGTGGDGTGWDRTGHLPSNGIQIRFFFRRATECSFEWDIAQLGDKFWGTDYLDIFGCIPNYMCFSCKHFGCLHFGRYALVSQLTSSSMELCFARCYVPGWHACLIDTCHWGRLVDPYPSDMRQSGTAGRPMSDWHVSPGHRWSHAPLTWAMFTLTGSKPPNAPWLYQGATGRPPPPLPLWQGCAPLTCLNELCMEKPLSVPLFWCHDFHITNLDVLVSTHGVFQNGEWLWNYWDSGHKRCTGNNYWHAEGCWRHCAWFTLAGLLRFWLFSTQ